MFYMLDFNSYTRVEIEKAAASARLVECDTDPKRRALAAYFRGGGVEPPVNGALPIEFEHKLYLVLAGSDAILAVYRVRNDLQLKRLRRIPLPVAALGEIIRKDEQLPEVKS